MQISCDSMNASLRVDVFVVAEHIIGLAVNIIFFFPRRLTGGVESHNNYTRK